MPSPEYTIFKKVFPLSMDFRNGRQSGAEQFENPLRDETEGHGMFFMSVLAAEGQNSPGRHRRPGSGENLKIPHFSAVDENESAPHIPGLSREYR
jgi:hypothetical protein